jgi:DNA-binding NarL/FixJ family response regulator
MINERKHSERRIPSGKFRIFLIDDQPIIRERLTELINQQPDLVTCGEAEETRMAMDRIEQGKPDLVITGLSFKHSHGLGLIKELRKRFPRLPVLVFSIYDELLYGERAIRAGARGFLEKRAKTSELLLAVRQVMRGEIYLSPKVAATTMRRFFGRTSVTAGSPLEQLSDRELEVLQLIGRGRSTRQIAAALHVDVKTIETYRGRIKVKLKLANSSELFEQAKRYLEQAISARV